MAQENQTFVQTNLLKGKQLAGTKVISVIPPCDPVKACKGGAFQSGKITFTRVQSGVATTSFALCSGSQFLALSGDPPFCTPVFPPSGPTQVLFRCNAKTNAWDFQALVTACVDSGQNEADWMIGFIQTVRKFDAVGTYTNGWKAVRTIGNKPARDCAPDNCPAPWMNPPGAAGTAMSRPVGLNESVAAEIVDNPNFPFPPFLPEDQKQPHVASLLRIDFDAIFDVFLVAQNTVITPSPPLVFIANVTVTVSQTATRNPPMQPDDPTAWTAKSNPAHSMGVPSAGKGSQTPVLDTPTANPLINKLQVTGPGQSSPTQPAPTQPAPTQPAPTQPAPTQPGPTQPGPKK